MLEGELDKSQKWTYTDRAEPKADEFGKGGLTNFPDLVHGSPIRVKIPKVKRAHKDPI